MGCTCKPRGLLIVLLYLLSCSAVFTTDVTDEGPGSFSISLKDTSSTTLIENTKTTEIETSDGSSPTSLPPTTPEGTSPKTTPENTSDPPPDTTTTEVTFPPTTIAPGCEHCNLGEECSAACGQIELPEDITIGEKTVLYSENADSYLEAHFDSRFLKSGELLFLTDLDPRTQAIGTPSTVFTCFSNMAGNLVTFKAYSGTLQVEMQQDFLNNQECPEQPTQIPRVIEFVSVPQSGESGLEPGELEFPAEGEVAPIEGGEWEWSVPVTQPEEGTGFGVNITVTFVNLDASLSDSLYINPGLKSDPNSGAVFSWSTNPESPRELRLFGRDSFYATLRLGQRKTGANMSNVGFKLTYSNFDPVTPPPTTTTTTTPLPSPPANVSHMVTKYVSGLEPEEFVLRIAEFQEAIAEVATQYCEKANIELAVTPVNPRNVLVDSVSRCPVTWPGAELCVAVKFSVPVFTVQPDYELTADNINKMWTTLVGTNNPLPSPMKPYGEPHEMLWWWIGVTLGVLVLVILFIITAWRVEVYHSISSYNRGSSLGSGSSKLGSFGNADMLPHQVVPPYMVMDLENVSNTRRTDIYSEQGWGFDNRDSYSVNEGMVNQAYEDDDDDEVDIFSRQEHGDEFGSGSDDEIVQAVGPPRIGQDLIYDTPSISSNQHIQLDHLGETNL